MEQALLELNQKLDALTQQVEALTDYVADQRRRQREWDELKADLTPIVNDLYLATVEQLAEIESDFQLEDLLYLLKRLARNVRTFENLLDQLESLQDLLRDLTPITNDAVISVVQLLDDLDRRGYFAFLRELRYIGDNIVAAFGPEDVRLLADNIVTILTAIKEMTQPEVMTMVQNLAQSVRQVEVKPDEVPVSFFGLLRQLMDPQVRRGLGLTLQMLKTVGEQVPANGHGKS